MTREGTLKSLHPVSEQWRSLDELSGTSEAETFAASEFPAAWDEVPTGQARRDFLKVMSASMSLAGLGACVRQPEEKIVPYVKQPEDVIPGKPRYYATSFTRGGYGFGVLAESHQGRPTHVEGNPDHPGSLGATDPSIQASVLELWDPERSSTVIRRGKPASWDTFAKEVLPSLEKIASDGGQGFRVLTGAVSSPSLATLIRSLRMRFPNAQWHQWEPIHRDEVQLGSELAFGDIKEIRYNFAGAHTILTVDADIMTDAPGRLAYARQVMSRRGQGGDTGLRTYAVESYPTSTGTVADHRFQAKASEMGTFLSDVAHELGVDGVGPGHSPLEAEAKAVAKDLKRGGNTSAVVVGDHLPAEVHLLGLAINSFLTSLGTIVEVTEPVHIHPQYKLASIEQLTKDAKEGQVQCLIVLDANPVYNAPSHLDFAQVYEEHIPLRIHAGLYQDETARVSHWHLPLSHYLETWGDVRAYDGTVSIVQPLIAPLYDSKSTHEILALFGGELSAKAADLVKGYWEAVSQGGDFEAKWNRALHDGFMADTRLEHIPYPVSEAANKVKMPPSEEGLEVVFRPCPNVYDGRYANNAWLQETPRPLSRVVWDNAIYMSPKTAEHLKVKNDELVRLTVGDKTVEGPVWVMPGAAKDVLTVHLGYGRTHGGEVLKGAGFSAYPLIESSKVAFGARVASVKRTYEVVTVQDHWTLQGRNHVRHATESEYRANPDFAQEPKKHVLPLSLYPDYEYTGRAWGMTIDLGACNGCNACMVACQSENNIPVVGKAQVAKGREMHWIRIDRYFEGDVEEPKFSFQPMTCMHCERAPCEPVCPANATVHGPEGLNQMVYNRCIGTRYCSNNCPYKVRRFNFHLYADWDSESLKAQRNPDVTVRGRGVMEKCTYCIQRIKEVTIQAKVDDHERIPDGKIRTACQSACPTDAIAFGDINDPNSKVAKLKKLPVNYTVLEELNVAPRTSYLAAVSNPNPELGEDSPKVKAHGNHH